MERGKFDPLHPKTFQPIVTKICIRGIPPSQMLSRLDNRFCFWTCTTLRIPCLGYCFLFWFFQSPTAKMHALILTQEMWFHSRMYLLRVAKQVFNILILLLPKPPNLWPTLDLAKLRNDKGSSYKRPLIVVIVER